MIDIRFTRDLRESIERLVTNDDIIGDGVSIEDFARTFAGGWSAALAAVLDIMGPAGRHDIEEGEPGEIERLRAENASLRAALASLGPPPAMRLAMYRQGIAAGVYSRMATGQGQESNVEDEAHRMLAAERALEVPR